MIIFVGPITQIGWQESSLRLRLRSTGPIATGGGSVGLCIRQAANQNNITKQRRRNREEACCNQEHAKAVHRVGNGQGRFHGRIPSLHFYVILGLNVKPAKRATSERKRGTGVYGARTRNLRRDRAAL